MPITRWDPFGDVMPLRERINRLFDEWPTGSTRENVPQSWAPMVDVEDRVNEIVITVEVPGMKQEEIDIELTGDVLTIKGERKLEREETQRNYIRMERMYGSFQRAFTLGVPIKADAITATYRDGLLMVTVPKADEVQPRKVTVKTQ